jgi:subtilisin family serine protease
MRNLPVVLCSMLCAASAVTSTQSRDIVPLVGTADSGAADDAPLSLEQGSTLWFVELASPPSADGTSPVSLNREEVDFHRQAAAAGVRYQRGRRFNSLWNGVTVRAGITDISKLRAIPGVQAVYPVSLVKPAQIETPSAPAPELATALAMTGADVAHSELGLSGAGVRVAVIDSGIDYDHPDLGGCFGPGCRVAKGYDLVGNAFNPDDDSPSFNPVATPDPLPDDCDGHGTHVSGIIGASGGITGVAPGVTFHAYRVFGCEGPTSADILLEAMELAFHSGADIINMSVGLPFEWPQHPIAKAATRLVRLGVVVVTSGGNEGTAGLYATSAPGVGADVIAVASVDNTHANLATFTVSPDGRQIGYTPATGAPPPPLEGTLPIARTGTTTSPDDACTALPAGSLDGYIALVRRGTCGFAIKAANAQAAGAAGVVIYNNATGRLNITVEGVPPITIPVVTITADDGAEIDSRVAAGGAELTWTSTVISEAQGTAGLVSSFSSFGTAPDLSLKPDIAAPGGSVRSTLPLELGGYGTISGTSMASPHVAGAVALMLEAQPRTRPKEVMTRLQNSARPVLLSNAPNLAFYNSVHRQGAGLLAVDAAITSERLVTPSKLALGEIESGSVSRVLRISADAVAGRRRAARQRRACCEDAVTYTLGHDPALATGPNTFTPTLTASFATVEFSSPSVTVSANRHASDERVLVTITPPENAAARLFGGYITLTPDDGSAVLRVPYSGYNGDYQAIGALTPTAAGLPWLTRANDEGQLVNQPDGATFTMVGDDVPFILFHLDHPVRALKMEVVEVGTGRSFQFATEDEFVSRNTTPTSVFGFAWDGTTTRRAGGRSRTVPNGTYRIDVWVLKALGDPSNPDHVEHWSSPEITIARP